MKPQRISRGSLPSAAKSSKGIHPDGTPLVYISYLRWESLDHKGESTWDSIYLSEDDAEDLCRQLDKALDFRVSGG